jgi:SAM-dependent methyltransferase
VKSIRSLLLAGYEGLPTALLWMFGRVLRARRGQDSSFIDRLSVRYETAVRAMGESHWRRKVETLELAGYERVLDLGCGPGQWLPVLAQCNRHVIGVDVSPAMLKVAKEAARLTPGVALVRSRAESLCFGPGTFDAVLCYGVLMYTEYENVLEEISRVLKPGGRLIVGLVGLGYYLKHVVEGVRHNREDTVRYGIEPIATRIGRALLFRRAPTVNFWTNRGIARALSQRGFDIMGAEEDLLDPSWPRSYAGARFFFCVEARKR